MKKKFYLPLLFFFFSSISFITAKAQYNFAIVNMDGAPIKGAKLVTAGKEPGYTDENGDLKYYVPNGYVTITAEGYKKMTKNVFGIKVGTEVIITMARLEPETRVLIIRVKDKKGKAVEGAMITVIPGSPAETDAAGNAQTTHKQQPGDYIAVSVSAKGYKDQEKQIMVGNNRKTYGGFGGVKTPEDEANFTLESSAGTIPLIIEVLDTKNEKPVNGASVIIKVMSSGAQATAPTVSDGEARFTINKGDQLRVMVKSKGYKEKWSDITSDLTMGTDNEERRFLVYITKEKEEDDADWNGTFTDTYSTFNFSGSAGSVSGNWTYVVSDSKGTASLSSTEIKGNTAKGTWKAQHEDNTKTGSRSGTFTITLNGDTITGQLVEDTPNWSYKTGYSAANVNSSMKKGAVWGLTISRKK